MSRVAPIRCARPFGSSERPGDAQSLPGRGRLLDTIGRLPRLQAVALHLDYRRSISVASWAGRGMRKTAAGRRYRRSSRPVQGNPAAECPAQLPCCFINIFSAVNMASRVDTYGTSDFSETDFLRVLCGSFSAVLGCGEIGVASCAGLDAAGLWPLSLFSALEAFAAFPLTLFLVVTGYSQSTRRRLQARHCGVSPEQRIFCSLQPSQALLARRLSGRASAAVAGDWESSEPCSGVAACENEHTKDRRSQLPQTSALPSQRT